MTRAQVHRIRWPVLLISRKDTYFHVAADAAQPLQHALADIAQWAGSDRLRLSRAADRFADVDVIDSARRRLRLVTGATGVRVRPGPDRKPVAEEELLRRLGTVLELLTATAAAIPGLAAATIPAPSSGFAAYLAQLGPILQSAHEEHVPAPEGSGTGQVAVHFAVAQSTGAQPAEPPDLALTGAHPVEHPRGWFHNLMHQAWG